ncbi:MarR family transcriptional regulator [Schlegelella sp. S2-27]|uniref:MarR family transcriptional regulator n=1 Tax=Caldimonas mangrovi TaxID=2944811 RepID=A0ABT0YVD4_9BURK|nr:MarR family transcriptional regulator [Caldimonas mangrovi]MCM5682264.1 MarR family transcriptional regulator [Caldimonas mangrovi]
MSTPPSPVGTWLSVVRAYHLCEAVMSTRLAELGVRLGEHEILVNLLSKPGITQQELAARCFSAKSHISALVTQLEERGLVRREPDPRDARAKQLYLTRAGEALARRTGAVQAQVVQAMTAPVSAEDMAHVAAVMARVSAALEKLL